MPVSTEQNTLAAPGQKQIGHGRIGVIGECPHGGGLHGRWLTRVDERGQCFPDLREWGTAE